MSQLTIGFIIFLINFVLVASILLCGSAIAMAGNVVLALLCVGLYGLWFGAYLVSQAKN